MNKTVLLSILLWFSTSFAMKRISRTTLKEIMDDIAQQDLTKKCNLTHLYQTPLTSNEKNHITVLYWQCKEKPVKAVLDADFDARFDNNESFITEEDKKIIRDHSIVKKLLSNEKIKK